MAVDKLRSPDTPVARQSQSAPNAPIPMMVKVTAAVVAFGAFMSALTTTVFNAALQSISSELGASMDTTHWVVTAYLLGYAAVIPVAGWAAQRLGAGRLWLLMLAIFTVLSAAGAFVNSIELLITSRALLGMAGGLLVPAGQIVLGSSARRDQLGRIMSIMGIPIVLAPLLGPTLGGILIQHLDWRWLFLVNVPLCVLGLILGWFLLKRTGGAKAGKLDVFGLILAAVAMPLLTYGVSDITVPGNSHVGMTAALIVIAVVLIAIFIAHALRSSNPLLELRLFKNKAFASAAITSLSLGAVLYGTLALLPQYFEQARGESALNAGLMVATQAIGALVATPISGWLCDRFGGGRVVISGLILALVATVPLALIGTTDSYWWLSVVFIARGVSIGLTVVPAMSTTYAVVRKDQIAQATPQLNLMQRLGGSLGVSMLAVIYLDYLSGDGDHVTAQASAHAIGLTHYWVIGLTILALIPAFVLSRAERRTRAQAAAAEAAAEGNAAPV
ncbi:MAG: DHA2 family efflux MFS transporter permease subunit [Actinocatenispora sp.]